MVLDRAGTQVDARPDVGVRQPFRNQDEDVALAEGEQSDPGGLLIDGGLGAGVTVQQSTTPPAVGVRTK